MFMSTDTMHYLDKIYEIRALNRLDPLLCLHIFNAQTNESISIRYDIRKLILNVVR
jgi:hypothetical protein